LSQYDLNDLASTKTTWTTDKNIVWLKINIQDNIFSYKYWDDNILDQLGSTCVKLDRLR
jgi:hypothetical protein